MSVHVVTHSASVTRSPRTRCRPFKLVVMATMRSSKRSCTLVAVAMVMMMIMVVPNSASARKPDGLVVVSRHGVRRQFPSSTHDFAKYAPGKTFATEDQVRVRVQVTVWFPVISVPLGTATAVPDLLQTKQKQTNISHFNFPFSPHNQVVLFYQTTGGQCAPFQVSAPFTVYHRVYDSKYMKY